MSHANLKQHIEFYLPKNLKDDNFLPIMERVLSDGYKGVNCNPDILDLFDINIRPAVWFTLDSRTSPVHFCGFYHKMVEYYLEMLPWLSGFNIPITGRYVAADLNEYRENGIDIRAWVHYPMSEYSDQVVDYLNNIEECGYSHIVLSTNKEVDLTDLIITVEKMRKSVALPIKIFHPGAKVEDVLKYEKHIAAGGIILPFPSL